MAAATDVPLATIKCTRVIRSSSGYPAITPQGYIIHAMRYTELSEVQKRDAAGMMMVTKHQMVLASGSKLWIMLANTTDVIDGIEIDDPSPSEQTVKETFRPLVDRHFGFEIL
jgi:hypothetical protein